MVACCATDLEFYFEVGLGILSQGTECKISARSGLVFADTSQIRTLEMDPFRSSRGSGCFLCFSNCRV